MTYGCDLRLPVDIDLQAQSVNVVDNAQTLVKEVDEKFSGHVQAQYDLMSNILEERQKARDNILSDTVGMNIPYVDPAHWTHTILSSSYDDEIIS